MLTTISMRFNSFDIFLFIVSIQTETKNELENYLSRCIIKMFQIIMQVL